MWWSQHQLAGASRGPWPIHLHTGQKRGFFSSRTQCKPRFQRLCQQPHTSSTGPDYVVQKLLGINDDDARALKLTLFHSKPMHEYCLVSFRKQPYSYTSDGGTAHSSYPKIGRSSISRCWPTNRRRRNMDSRSKTTWSPILIPCLSFSIVFTGELIFVWNPAGSDLRKSVTISAPSDKASDTLTTAGTTCPFTMLYRTSLSISKGWERVIEFLADASTVISINLASLDTLFFVWRLARAVCLIWYVCWYGKWVDPFRHLFRG